MYRGLLRTKRITSLLYGVGSGDSEGVLPAITGAFGVIAIAVENHCTAASVRALCLRPYVTCVLCVRQPTLPAPVLPRAPPRLCAVLKKLCNHPKLLLQEAAAGTEQLPQPQQLQQQQASMKTAELAASILQQHLPAAAVPVDAIELSGELCQSITASLSLSMS